MDINHYQLAAMRTCIHIYGSVDHKALAWNALGLTGEAGDMYGRESWPVFKYAKVEAEITAKGAPTL